MATLHQHKKKEDQEQLQNKQPRRKATKTTKNFRMIKEPKKTMLLFSALLFLSTFLLLQPHFSHSLPLLESSPSNEEEDKSEVQQQQQSSTTDSPSPPEHPLLFSLPEYEEGGAQSPCWNYLFGNSGPQKKKDEKPFNFWPSLKATLHGHCVREAQNAHHLPSLIYDAREYEPVRVAFCAAMYQAVGCFRRTLCTICGDLHTRYQAVFDSQNADNLFSENQENLQLFAWNGTAYEQAMIEALEEKVPFCAGELPVKAASLKEDEENFCQTGSGLSTSSALERNFLSDVEEGVAAGVSDLESPLARLNVVFDALGQAPARFTPAANESTTAYVTPTSTYVMIVCFVVASAAFVGAIVWLMMKLNDDDRIQKENSVRPVVMASPKENLEGRSSSGGVLSGGGRGGPPSGKLTKGVADGKSILTIDRKVRSKVGGGGEVF